MNKPSRPTIGVLALQGAVDLHKPHIEACGAQFARVKTPAQFDAVDAFILPGGESTTMLKLIETFDLWEALKRNFAAKPVWGICAGAILMAEHSYRTDNLSSRSQPETARKAANDQAAGREQKSFGLLPLQIRRNGYGTQMESHRIEIKGCTVSFIRAPVITDSGDCTVKASHHEAPVWVQKGSYMATTFHPELALETPSPMHREFVEIVSKSR